MSLNPRQKRFVEAYHVTGSATGAYVEVYGVAQKSAECAGPRLLGNVEVQEYLKSLQLIPDEEFSTERADMLKMFATIAFDKQEETKDRIVAGKEVCRIRGHYEAKKLEVTADAEVVEMLRAVMGAKES